MQERSYRFRVYTPFRALLLLLAMGASAVPIFMLMDAFGPGWMQYREARILLVAAILGFPFYYLFRGLVTAFMEITITNDGLKIDHLPRWIWGKHAPLYLSWMELERWIYKKSNMNAHSIPWDRLWFVCTDGRKFLALPAAGFDSNDPFSVFLEALRQTTEAYNKRPSTHIPIASGSPQHVVSLKAWLLAILSLAMGGITLFALYLIYREKNTDYLLITGCALMVAAFGYQFWKQVKIIRNPSAS